MHACANLGFLFKESGSLLNRYKAAVEAGFKLVECDFPHGISPSELGKTVHENGLTQVLINCFQGNDGQMGFGATPVNQMEFKEALETTVEYAKATGCHKIHILSGRNLGPSQRKEQLQTLEQNLTWASKRLKEDNIIGLIEPINPYSKPNYFLNNYEDALTVLGNINSPNIRLQLDLFHLQLIAGDISHNVEKLLPYAGHVQVAQAPHRHEPSSAGELDMKYVFDLLRNLGYVGPVGCEYTPSKTTLDSMKWIKDLELEF